MPTRIMQPYRKDTALARCSRCGTRPRVLPYDVLPLKRYALAVIAEQAGQYTKGSWSLRGLAWELLGERTPAYTTLHGWSEGLGAHALGLPGGEASGSPFSRFLAEADARVRQVRTVFEAPVWVDARRYRSEPRRERLEAMARLFAVAAWVPGEPSTDPLPECRRLARVWSGSSVLEFPSRFSCTAIEHGTRLDRRGSPRTPRTSRSRCPTRTRSPPGASSRSRHC